jgi:hypothetical protein
MGEAKRRCKDPEERALSAIKRREEQELAEQEAERARLSSLTPEEIEQDKIRRKKANRINTLLATALAIGYH